MKKTTAKKIYGILLALLAWTSVGLQLYLTTGSVINFFSYFTVLSNILVALTLTCSFFMPSARLLTGPSAQTAIALYIFIVGLVYNVVLRGIWSPTGLQLVVDNLLHVIVPLLYILYWVLFVPKDGLKWKNGLAWMIFPLAYLVYSLVRGSIVHWYPYPFLDVDKWGYEKVFLNVLVMVAVFLVAGLILIGISRSKRSRS